MSEEEFQHQTNAVLTSGIQMWNSLWRLKSTAFTKETWTRRICKEHYPVPVYRLLAQNTRMQHQETHFSYLDEDGAQRGMQVVGYAHLSYEGGRKHRHLESSLIWGFSQHNPEAIAESHPPAMETEAIIYKATEVTAVGRRSFSNIGGFLALGSSKEIHKTRPGHGNQILESPWYTRLLFQDRSNSDQNGEWDFPCIGHNTYVCSRKKSWSKKT
ncbi:uncharacterized protein LOC114008879 isoform X1 [Tupaia chinensis]|uniref:uncharacterized protein LOC114008879 isoform X1 n=1 Tax=Tupaia chinensis TaxID=246437 RepID=UPI000FFBDC49|nr:uncharacterized protein LOC114008879 isoform X1 [Tupaia chinensis]